MAKKKKINIIKSKYSFQEIIHKINFCNDISTILSTKKMHVISEDQDLSEFIKEVAKTKYTYYPIVDKQQKCLGIIKVADEGFYNKKKVILVDHNSYEQSAIGLNEAEILEIIDHHNISNIGTNNSMFLINKDISNIIIPANKRYLLFCLNLFNSVSLFIAINADMALNTTISILIISTCFLSERFFII